MDVAIQLKHVPCKLLLNKQKTPFVFLFVKIVGFVLIVWVFFSKSLSLRFLKLPLCLNTPVSVDAPVGRGAARMYASHLTADHREELRVYIALCVAILLAYFLLHISNF